MLIPFTDLFQKYNINCTGLLHCGASYCQELEEYQKLKIPQVLWVEAIPEIYEESRIKLSPYSNHLILNACVADETGRIVKFNISNNESQSSSMLELGHHKIIHPEVHYKNQLELVTIRLDDLMQGWDISGINFGNFDLQGAELMALIGLGELIHQFDYFYLELNKKEVYKGCALVNEIDEFLSAFQRVETGKWVGDSWTDGLYIRKSLL